MSRPLATLVPNVLAVPGPYSCFPPVRLRLPVQDAPRRSGRRTRPGRIERRVLSGQVVEIDPPSSWKGGATIETDAFRVSEVWKGPEHRTLKVHTALVGASRGHPLKEKGKSTWSTPTPGSGASRSISATGPSGSPGREHHVYEGRIVFL